MPIVKMPPFLVGRKGANRKLGRCGRSCWYGRSAQERHGTLEERAGKCGARAEIIAGGKEKKKSKQEHDSTRGKTTVDFSLSHRLQQQKGKALLWRLIVVGPARPGNVRLQAKKLNHTVRTGEVTRSDTFLLISLALMW